MQPRPHPRRDRTIRLLEAQLDALAGASERSPAEPRPLDRRVLSLEVATRHAVELRVISREEARAIWTAVASRHPEVRWCREGWDGCDGLAA